MNREQAYIIARRWGFGPFPPFDGRPSCELYRREVLRRLDNVLLPAALSASKDALRAGTETAWEQCIHDVDELMWLREFYSGCSVRDANASIDADQTAI